MSDILAGDIFNGVHIKGVPYNKATVLDEDDPDIYLIKASTSSELNVATALSKDSEVSNLGTSQLVTSNLSPQVTSAASLSFKTDLTPTNALVYLDGVFMTRGVDYTIVGKDIKFTDEYSGLIRDGSVLSIMYTTTD